MKRITIVAEALARPALETLLDEVGAQGYTAFTVEGSGAKGKRTADMDAFANIQFEVILQPGVADRLLGRLQKDYFPRFTMIAYETEVRVLRQNKF